MVLSNTPAMFLHLHVLGSLKALLMLIFRYVCVDVGRNLLQMRSFSKKCWIFYTVKQMQGLDDSDKSNFLQKIDDVLSLDTSKVHAHWREHAYHVCLLTCSKVQVCGKINFPNEGMTNEEPDGNIFYIFKCRSFCLVGDWK